MFACGRNDCLVRFVILVVGVLIVSNRFARLWTFCLFSFFIQSSKGFVVKIIAFLLNRICWRLSEYENRKKNAVRCKFLAI